MANIAAVSQTGILGASRRRRWQAIEGYLFILPWLMGFFAFTAGPMVASLVMTFTRYEILIAPEWSGLENYVRLLNDSDIRLSLYNTVYYVLLYVPLHLATALAAAVALNVRYRGVSLYRTMYYLPAVVPSVASIIMWMWIFNPDFGLMNAFLGLFGVPKIEWLYDTRWAKPAFVVVAVWALGNAMVIFLAGLQGVPEQLYEAAAIDGANSWDRFVHVTVPMITPVIFFNLVISIIASFQVFNIAYIATNGGPQDSTLFLVLYLYRSGFQQFQMGYASTIAWMLFVIILVFTIIQFRLSERWVYYEGDERR